MKTITIHNKESRKTYIKKLAQLKIKGLDAKRFSGKLRIESDPVEMQKKLRNEWE